MTHYDTIVIGLGAAGATAASTLVAAGKRVLALEAQDRVGGRVNTVSFGDGVVELGAEWIHGQTDGTTTSRLYEAAVKNNVEIIPQEMNIEVYRSDGTKADSSLIIELLGLVLFCTEDPPEEPEPVGQFTTRRLLEYIKETHPEILNDQDFITEFLNFADLIIDNLTASNSWNDISTSSQYEKLDGHQHLSWHKHGYKTFMEILLNTYHKGSGLPTLTIKLNTEVRSIEYSEEASNPVLVTVADGKVYTADNVIVTVSLGVLKERHATLFTPKLPQSKITAIDKLSIGLMGKILLLFPNQWVPSTTRIFGFIWQGDDKKKISKEDEWVTRIYGVSRPMGCDNALTVWTSGETGKLVETLPEDLVKRKTMELIRKFMGADVEIPEPTKMLRTTWHSNPFTRGSYSYDNIETPNYPTLRSDLAAPLIDSSGKPKVLFAGEATHPTHFSTVHGAAESGYREAARILF